MSDCCHICSVDICLSLGVLLGILLFWTPCMSESCHICSVDICLSLGVLLGLWCLINYNWGLSSVLNFKTFKMNDALDLASLIACNLSKLELFVDTTIIGLVTSQFLLTLFILLWYLYSIFLILIDVLIILQ